MIEIERKFLVHSTEFVQAASQHYRIEQGYLSKDPARTVRVRIKNDKSFITVKGASSASGMSRYEWEKEIPLEEGKALLQLALPTVIQKTRYEVKHQTFLFEVDVFEGQHQGLILAEVELEDENVELNLPTWIGEEVTGDPRYYNASYPRWRKKVNITHLVNLQDFIKAFKRAIGSALHFPVLIRLKLFLTQNFIAFISSSNT